MKEYNSLKFFDKFEKVFTKFDIDYPVMRKILQVKLTLDGRRSSILHKSKVGEEDSNNFIKSLWMYALMGLFMVAIMFLNSDPFVKMMYFFGGLMFILATNMIAEFSTVLLDVKDNIIIGTKPVSRRTLGMAKFLHILVYLSLLCGALGGLSILAAAKLFGIPFALLIVIELALICSFTILMTAVIYTLLLKFFDGEKLKDVINIFQILLTIIVSVGYQLLSRMINLIGLRVEFTAKWWIYFLPPAWFAAPFEVIFNHNFSPIYVTLTILNILMPVLGLTLYIKIVAPSFERYITKLENSDSVAAYSPSIKSKFFDVLTNLISKNDTENSFLHFSRVILTKERSTKLRVYPQMAMATLIPIFILALSYEYGMSFTTYKSTIIDGHNFLISYISIALVPSLYLMISFSDCYNAAWIYKVLPIENPGVIYKATFKAFIISYIIPLYIFLGVLLTSIMGLGILPDLLLMFSYGILLILIVNLMTNAHLPFSVKYVQSQASAKSTMIAFTCLTLTGIMAAFHFFTMNIKNMELISTGVILIIIFIMIKVSFKTTWEDIERRLEKES